MDFVNSPAFVNVSRCPETGKMIALTVAVILCAIAIVGGLAMRRLGSAIILIPLVLASAAARRAGRTSETRCVEATLTWQDPYLLVFLPDTRLYDGRYVDQQYACERSQVDFAGFNSQGDFVLRARQMDSVACQGAQEIERKHMDHVEVSFKVMADYREKVSKFLAMYGLA